MRTPQVPHVHRKLIEVCLCCCHGHAYLLLSSDLTIDEIFVYIIAYSMELHIRQIYVPLQYLENC